MPLVLPLLVHPEAAARFNMLAMLAAPGKASPHAPTSAAATEQAWLIPAVAAAMQQATWQAVGAHGWEGAGAGGHSGSSGGGGKDAWQELLVGQRGQAAAGKAAGEQEGRPPSFSFVRPAELASQAEGVCGKPAAAATRARATPFWRRLFCLAAPLQSVKP